MIVNDNDLTPSFYRTRIYIHDERPTRSKRKRDLFNKWMPINFYRGIRWIPYMMHTRVARKLYKVK